ncbi:LysM peptidoglycan-binding domain-containing protein [Brevibacillus sp. TJ4]|uniref:LysM peptidoglycan-binding domain-containing protein n=1 Tax=Brevibacillus sp. TJ4 TaxID=3234853 RepID=UPI003BA3C2E5
MALQDGLLTFTIKETIFLSSDKAGIGELQELELVPDVEVLENQSYISITGCLQLYGKYEPIRDTAEGNSGGTESLVEAMSFAPFQRDAAHGWEEQIGHRIPLNITIPVERIADVSDIYAVVDSFDYKLESPHQMLIEAELKLGGIQFADLAESEQQQTAESAQVPLAEEQTAYESWEFSHVAAEAAEESAEPSSLEEIEQKLTRLEQEMEIQERHETAEARQSTGWLNPAALPASATYGQTYGDVSVNEQEQETGSREFSFDADSGDEGDSQEASLEAQTSDSTTDELVREEDSQPFGFTAANIASEAAEESNDSQPEPRVTHATASEYPQTGEAQQVAGDLFDQPALPASALYGQTYGDVGPKETQKAGSRNPAYQEQTTDHAQQDTWLEEQYPGPAADEPVVAIHDMEPPAVGYTSASVRDSAEQPESAQQESVPAHAPASDSQTVESVEASASPQQDVSQETSASPSEEYGEEAVEAAAEVQELVQEEAEQTEVRVAISGKPMREEGGGISITSIFSQASRARQEAEEINEQSSSSSSRKGALETLSAPTLEAVQNLTSFVRNREERSSQLKLCIIQRDETLEQISQRYSLPVSKLLEVNRMSSSDQLVAGQILYIPQ